MLSDEIQNFNREIKAEKHQTSIFTAKKTTFSD